MDSKTTQEGRESRAENAAGIHVVFTNFLLIQVILIRPTDQNTPKYEGFPYKE